MRHIIGIDVASEVSSAVVMGKSGKVVMETNLVTSASNICQLVKSVKAPCQVVFEECCEATWLYSILEPICDDVFVCNPKKNKALSGHSKTDRSDAFHLADRARGGHLSRVWHGGKEFQILKERLRLYQSLTQESTALKNKIKAVFRGRGIRAGSAAYEFETRCEVVKKLPLVAQRERVLRLGIVLDTIGEQREGAKSELVKAVRQNTMFKSLSSMDGIADIYAATIISEVGTPQRFRTRKQFWSYVGLAVTTHETAQYYADKRGAVQLKERKVKTRGLVRQYNRTLKGVFKQVALRQSQGKWKAEYEKLAKRTTHNKALLTLARKAAAISLHLMKTGELYDPSLVFAQK